jgi:hypothetical protein
MKLKSNLTKRYYFPIVEGSNYGYVFNRGTTYNAFVTYIRSGGWITKVTNYSQVWHWFAGKAVQLRKGYYVGWWAEGERMLRDLSKANKYLNRQYNRIDKHIRNGDLDKAIGVWEILHTRSRLWVRVLIVRKLPFLSMRVLRVEAIARAVLSLNWANKSSLRYKRVFLPEYKTDGTLKKMRPLGVPSQEWRIIAASYEFILANLWHRDWATNQYACMPGRGVADAWIEILRRLSTGEIDQVIGYDLAKFFDTVYLSNIVSVMANLPRSFVMWMTKTMRRKPLIRPQDRIHEKERIENTLRERPLDYYNEPNSEGVKGSLRIRTEEGERVIALDEIKTVTVNAPPKWVTWMVKLLRLTGAITEEEAIPAKSKTEEFFLGGIIPLEELLRGKRKFTVGELGGKKLPQYQNKGDVSLPQGLNTSPIIACRVLQETGALHENVIQYVDDGIIMNTRSSRYTLEELRRKLDTRYSGITLSEAKTEVIMEGGKWIKPLKFLGCMYDGKTFKASTRKGVYVVENADQRIAEIMVWLRKNGNLLGNYKRMMTSLISEGWNPPKSSFWSLPARIAPRQGFEGGLITSFSTWWEETRSKVERLPINSVEAMAIETLGPKLGPIISSSNTASMVGSYYLLKFTKVVKYPRRSTAVEQTVREPNRLLADW